MKVLKEINEVRFPVWDQFIWTALCKLTKQHHMSVLAEDINEKYLFAMFAN